MDNTKLLFFNSSVGLPDLERVVFEFNTRRLKEKKPLKLVLREGDNLHIIRGVYAFWEINFELRVAFNEFIRTSRLSHMVFR